MSCDCDSKRPDQFSPSSPPLLKYARREALFVMGLWLAALIYTVSYCYLFGYMKHNPPLRLFGQTLDLSHFDRKVENLQLILGVPDWVMWGVMLPWFVCLFLTSWFCFWFMKDEDLGRDYAEELEERIREERHRD